MDNGKIVAIIRELADVQGKGNYSNEMLWGELCEECVKELRKMVTRKQYVFTSDYAQEDFEQDVMMVIFENLHRYDATRAQFNTWFRRISANIYNKFYNQQKRLMENDVRTISMYIENDENEEGNIIDCYKYSKSVEKDYFYSISCGKLYNAIQHLKDNYRDVVMLCDMAGFKPGEAADILGQKREIVYRWLNRAHDKLEKFIVDEDMEEDIYDEYNL